MFSNASSGTVTSPTAAAGFSKTASSAPPSRSREAAFPSPTKRFALGPPSPAVRERSSTVVGLQPLSRTAGEGAERSEAGEGLAALQKTIRVEVDLDTGGPGGADAGEPIPQYRLEAHVAARLDEEAAAVAAAQDSERGGSRAEHRHPGQLRC